MAIVPIEVGDYTSTVSGLTNGDFLFLCALWANLVGDADVGRNAEWGCQRLDTAFLSSLSNFGKEKMKAACLLPP